MIKLTICRRCTRQGIIREIFGCVKSVRKSYADYTARNILAYLHCFNEYDENIKKYIYHLYSAEFFVMIISSNDPLTRACFE